MPDSVKDLFDDKAQSWSQKYRAGGPLAERRDRIVRAIALRLSPPARLLDFGCGTGDLALQLQTLGYAVVGCDLSSKMLSVARQRGSGVEWRQLTTDPGLPFRDHEFDAVVASSVLEYVDDLPQVLNELSRIVRTRGLLFVTAPNLRHPVRWVEWLARRLALRAVPGWLNFSHPLVNYARYLKMSRNRLSLSNWAAILWDSGFSLAPEGSGNPGSLVLLVAQRMTAIQGRT